MSKAIAMENPVHKAAHILIGFVGGCVTLLNAPHIFLSSLIGSGLVAMFLAMCSFFGNKIAVYCWAGMKRKWKNYKIKK